MCACACVGTSLTKDQYCVVLHPHLSLPCRLAGNLLGAIFFPTLENGRAAASLTCSQGPLYCRMYYKIVLLVNTVGMKLMEALPPQVRLVSRSPQEYPRD